MAFGLTPEGLVIPTLQEVRDWINAKVWATISPTLDLSDGSLEGQIIGIVAEAIHKVYQLNEATYSAFDPDKAVDAALDAICILTGTKRRGATKSATILTFTGDPATVVPSGTGARIPGGAQFDTTEAGALVAVSAWAPATTYALDVRVTNGGNVYQCTLGGISAGSGGPSSTDPLDFAHADGTATWRYLGAGTAADDVAAAATVTGPTVANAGTITEIATPVGGVDGVVNVTDATVGRNQMTNAELRVLRELELARPGTSPINAIRAALLELDGVTSAFVFNNPSDNTVDGMPPHSVEAMVQGGDDQEILDCLLANVAAGIQTHGQGAGAVTGTATDSQGISHTVKFTRPSDVPIYIAITLTKESGVYPADGDAQVEQAIVDFGAQLAAGKDAVAWQLGAQAIKVAGVINVTACYIGTAPAPGSSATIVISPRERAVYSTDRITVTSSNGTP